MHTDMLTTSHDLNVWKTWKRRPGHVRWRVLLWQSWVCMEIGSQIAHIARFSFLFIPQRSSRELMIQVPGLF